MSAAAFLLGLLVGMGIVALAVWWLMRDPA